MKNKLFKLLLTTMLLPAIGKAQTIYFDPAVTGSMAGYAISLKNGQNKIADEQTKLQKAQTFISGQMALVNQVQEKVYKGLTEVSTTLTNGMQLKNIWEQLKQCQEYSSNVLSLAKKHPQYAVFGVKASEKAYEEILKLTAEINSVIDSKGKNLMTAGDRYRLLDSIESKIRSFKLWLLTIQIGMENAQRIGFWRAISPFDQYINTDKDIVENIMRKFKHTF